MSHFHWWEARLGLLLVACLLFPMLSSSALAQSPMNAPVIVAPVQLSFAPIEVPMSAAAKAGVRTTSQVAIDAQVYPLAYHTIFHSGDQFASGTFGQILDIDGNPIMDGDEPFIADEIDYTSILPRGDKIYLVTHIESTPAAIYVSEVIQDEETGLLTPVDTKAVDFAEYDGVLETCAGTTTPWSSHLGSEEWDPDAKYYDPATGSIDDEDYDEAMLAYFGPEGSLTDMSPYNYGWTPEVFVDDEGNATGVKHYALGRFAHELAYVMPDERTVYMTDDETNGAIFLFIADKAADLSAGTLYAAKWLQTDDAGVGSADIAWIKLASGNDSEIRQSIDDGIQFTDLFEEGEAADDGSCSADFTSINTTTGHECLRVQPGMEQSAAFLESRRYAALLGATTEFAGNEGISYDDETGTVYMASSGLGDGMLDAEEEYDLGGNNDIRLATATSCGGIYAMPVAAEQMAYSAGYAAGTDPDEAMDSEYVIVNAVSELMGYEWNEEEAAARGVPAEYNVCSVDGIAEPDNVAFIPGSGTLLIAEDSEEHENDILWAYNTRTERLTRIQSAPQGAEFSTPYFYPDVNGWAYLTSAVQHPFDEDELVEDFGYPEDEMPHGDTRASLGYIGPLPAFTTAPAATTE
jgi:uncharacterized protein